MKIYVRYNPLRKEQYQLETSIVKEDGKFFVCKQASVPAAKKFVSGLIGKYEYLKKNNLPYEILPPVATPSGIKFTYNPHPSLFSILQLALKNHNQEDFLSLLQRYKKLFSEHLIYDIKPSDSYARLFGPNWDQTEPCLTYGCLDLNFDNFFFDQTNHTFYLSDYEWTFEFPIPINYIFFRALSSFYFQNHDYLTSQNTSFSHSLEALSIPLDSIEKYIQAEYHFQKQILQDNVIKDYQYYRQPYLNLLENIPPSPRKNLINTIATKTVQTENDFLKIKNQELKEKIKSLENAFFWRSTKPLRQSLDYVKSQKNNLLVRTKNNIQTLAPHVPNSIKNLLRPWYYKYFLSLKTDPNPFQIDFGRTLPQADNYQNGLFSDHLGDIFVFPIIDWEHRFQRPQQIACRLADFGFRIFYFRTTNNLAQPDDSDVELLTKIQVKPISDRIFLVTLAATRDLDIYNSSLTDSDDINLLLRSINLVKKKYYINFTINKIDQPFWISLVKKLENNKIIYDCMDEHAGFTDSPSVLADEKKLLTTADLVLTSSDSLFAKAKLLSKNVALLKNGADFRHFNKLSANQLIKLKHPIIGYYGAISSWFDSQLVADCARAYPDCNFVLIGNTRGANLSPLANLKNIHLLGEIKYDQLPKYLYHFDVCLIPFIINNLTLATNPVKFYEYMCSGKPVVTVALPELKEYQDVCYFSNTPAEFVANIKQALSEKKEMIVKKRIKIAKNNSWDQRVEVFSQKMTDLFPKISIIVVTFNNLELTKVCLDSIFRYSRYPNLKVIVVDNSSQDGTPQYLQELSQKQPNLKLILNKDNKGFAIANNQGIKIADSEYIVFLNNDTVVTNNWLYGLLSHFQQEPKLGLLGPVTNNIGNEARISVNYKDLDQMQIFADDYCRQHSGEIFDIKVTALFCAMAKKNNLEKVGLISEEYERGWFEDDDLANKMRQIGLKVMCCEDVFIHHIGGASFGKIQSEEYQRLWNKNKATYEKKWGKWERHQGRKQ